MTRGRKLQSRSSKRWSRRIRRNQIKRKLNQNHVHCVRFSNCFCVFQSNAKLLCSLIFSDNKASERWTNCKMCNAYFSLWIAKTWGQFYIIVQYYSLLLWSLKYENCLRPRQKFPLNFIFYVSFYLCLMAINRIKYIKTSIKIIYVSDYF